MYLPLAVQLCAVFIDYEFAKKKIAYTYVEIISRREKKRRRRRGRRERRRKKKKKKNERKND